MRQVNLIAAIHGRHIGHLAIHRELVRAIICLILLVGVCGCAAAPLHTPVPEAMSSRATLAGFPSTIRYWADEAPPDLSAQVVRRVDAYRAAQKEYFEKHHTYPDLNYLAISGGAYDGAFGAGLLSGWTASGTRPNFAIVSGVSTGALIAPFIFIGPRYDATVRDLFTKTNSDNIFMASAWGVVEGITGGLALTDSAPLAKKIEDAVTPAVMEEVAAEHRKGKRLYIGTTNIEAQRGVIWDIGAIANSHNPNALKLIHQIMLASASIPGAFSPVFIDVEAGGTHYSEIHADGGVTSQVFIYPLRIQRSVIDIFTHLHMKRHLYIVRNSKITPEYQALQPGFFALSRRSIETLTKYQGIGDLYRLYIGAQRDGIDYNLAYIPENFTAESKELFDPAYMQKLFDVGYEMGKKPDIWMKKPPGVDYAPEMQRGNHE